MQLQILADSLEFKVMSVFPVKAEVGNIWKTS